MFSQSPKIIESKLGSIYAWKHVNMINIKYIIYRLKNNVVRDFYEKSFKFINMSDLSYRDEFIFSAEQLLRQNILDDYSSELVAMICYIASRDTGYFWEGLNNFLKKRVNEVNEWTSGYISSKKFHRIPSIIRQCRPDKDYYSKVSLSNVGFFSKNPEISYYEYGNEQAENYIIREFGFDFLKMYNYVKIPQAKSDFFLLLSLYKEGGVSSDVCSVSKCSITNLVNKISGIGIVFREGKLCKNFICCESKNEILKKYISKIVNYISYCMSECIECDYELLTSNFSFNSFILDSYCEKSIEISPNSISFINHSFYDAFIDSNDEEENLSNNLRNSSFETFSLFSIDKEKIFSDIKNKNYVYGSIDGYYLNSSDNVLVVGHDRTPTFKKQVQRKISIPKLNLFKLQDLGISGHACLWYGNKYAKLDSYLSLVAEQEAIAGHWMNPKNCKNIRYIEEPLIISFGAGYGCYGHYIVDDIPRLALSKKLLGDLEFYSRKILIPKKTPVWALEILKFFFNLSDDNFITFDHETEFVRSKDCIVPSFCHRDYNFHPFLRDFYTSFHNNNTVPHKRICVSRKGWEDHKINQRVFESQSIFEEIAKMRGFEIVHPETMNISDQIKLFSETRCQIGEHGSGQHASVYNKFGMTVGTVNPLTEIQTNLGRIYGDTNILLYGEKNNFDKNGNLFFNNSIENIKKFFDKVDEEDLRRDCIYR
ncbi:glycosyltransferase 61 family protein [Acetobacter thailandicus]|uniref:Glycosyltransferase 61 family protein n=1 Tax=Acetobacter thailandicus TaxID=1502842 RepID=A0ABT3QHI3_9PROT|nr:glycosyltransferase 61 family protein [Acetobacter thailandicus]MCX2564753.1 glycosyltransferase 61 family protein [Acetobacter thailandicus]NHN96256.1 DUF563 domain-containing protein [Acetobacter thailandicus]